MNTARQKALLRHVHRCTRENTHEGEKELRSRAAHRSEERTIGATHGRLAQLGHHFARREVGVVTQAILDVERGERRVQGAPQRRDENGVNLHNLEERTQQRRHA